ncbi:MAG: Crp/Fnr family transcriptional regulator [Eubacteriales bacterium]
MNRFLHMIENTSLMKSLSHEEIEYYLDNRKFKVVSYNKNSVIHLEGQPCRSLEVILSGRVAVDRIDESGNLLTISEFYSGDILGGNLLFSKDPYYPMTVTSVLPSDILEIDKELLFELFCKNSAFLKSFLEFVSDHAFILGDKIKHYVNKTIRESILSYLDYEIKKQNSQTIKLSLTKKALAEKIGVQRTSLSRELKKMKEDGLIQYDADSIELLRKE